MPTILSVADAIAAWERLTHRWNAAVKSGQRPSHSVIQDLFRTTAFVLRAYRHPANWINGRPKEHLPKEFTYAIERQVDYIAQGQLPDPIRDCIEANRPRVGPQERDDILWAVIYCHAVRKGLIEDSSPIETVTREYGVSRRTVMRWNRQNRAVNLNEGLRHFAPSEAPALFASEMRKAGKHYRRDGRSSAAIAFRNRKRHPGVT
jgi:hypothetical protein